MRVPLAALAVAFGHVLGNDTAPRLAAATTVYAFPYLDPTRPVQERVENLISLLTLEEKAAQLSSNASAVPRILLPPWSWSRECERGDSSGGALHPSTAYPDGMALASTFNAPLVWAVGLQTAVEVRAHVNDGAGTAMCFGPVSNLVRHPQWGRSGEMVVGEDPTLGRILSRGFTWGMLGGVPGSPPGAHNMRLVSSVAKHLNTYGGPEGTGYTFGPFAERFSFNAAVPHERVWREWFLPAFYGSAEAGTSGFMCSYSSLTLGDDAALPPNVPACADSYLLNTIARGEWDWEGYVLSDAGAVAFIGSVEIGGVTFGHGYSVNDTDSAVKALSGGCDVELTCCGAPATYWRLPDAVRAGAISEAALDAALNRTLPWRFAVGALDPRGTSPYDSLTSAANATTPGQMQLALDAAVQAAVLLKNDGLLPLSPAALVGKRVCVLGPNANNTLSLMGGYVNVNAGGRGIITVYAGLVTGLPGSTVLLAEGCNTTACPAVDPSAVATARTCDVNIFVGGLTAYAYSKNESTACGCPAGNAIEGECCDRESVSLPGAQLSFIQSLSALPPPLILISINAGMLDLSWPQASPAVGAMLTTAYPGQTGGTALATLLVGEASPSGRLVTTYYGGLGLDGNVSALIGDIKDYSMANRTYKAYDGVVQYTFGYGLSYAAFEYKLTGLSVVGGAGSRGGGGGGAAGLSITPCDVLNVSYTVRNSGSWPGLADEVPQLYLSLPPSSVPVPRVSLVTFDRLPLLGRGESREAYLLVLPEDHSVMREGDWARQVEPGVRSAWLGGASPAVPGAPVPAGVPFTFIVEGGPTLVSACPRGQPKQVWGHRQPGEGGAQVWAPVNV